LPAELPGVSLESDYDNLWTVITPPITEDDVVAAAMQNANLAPSQELLEITGVNLPDTDDNPHDDAAIYVSDDEDDPDDMIPPANDDDDGVMYMGNNPYVLLGDDVAVEIDDTDTGEDYDNDQQDYDPDPGADMEEEKESMDENHEHTGVRRSKRNKKKKLPPVIDFTKKRSGLRWGHSCSSE
jgi:hypothetical protein